MTHNEMIAVIQADKEGKEIQYSPKYSGGNWYNCSYGKQITWNFELMDYRIKPEPHYRPFKNAEEVMEAIKGRGYYARWKEDGRDYIIGAVCDDYIQPYLDDSYTLAEAFESFTWPDGTPFGVKED